MRSVIAARFMGLFAWCAGLSIVITAMTQIKIIPETTQGLGIAMFCGMFIYVIVQIIELRMDFHVMQKRDEYLTVNLSAYAILVAISMVIRPLLNFIGGFFGHGYAGNIIHTWLFVIYKFAMFSNADIGWVKSSLIGHAIIFALIFIAPIGMRKYFFSDQLGRW